MYCSQCHAPNPEGSTFCMSCGARLAPGEATSSGGRPSAEVPRSLRPMGIGDIFDETIRLYRRHFRTFVAIVAVVQVPLAILQMVWYAIVGPSLLSFQGLASQDEVNVGPIELFLGLMLLALIGGLAFVVTQGALASAISEGYLGRRSTVGRAYGAALARFLPLLGAILLSGIVGLLLVVTVIGIPVALYLGIRWALTVPSIVLENRGVIDGLSRSWGLVKDHWWRTLGILLVVFVAQYLVAVIPGAIIGGILGFVGGLVAPGQLIVTYTISAVVGAIFGILAAPLVPTVITLLYYDLRIRKEGFDLQVMAERLGQGQTPSFESPA